MSKTKKPNESKNQFPRSTGAFRGRSFAFKDQSKAPTIPSANLQTQSSQANNSLTAHKVSSNPPANSPKNVPSPKPSIMDVSIGTDKQGNPTEINVFITKEQYERFGGKLNDFSFNFGDNIDERVQNLVKQGKVNYIILTKEQEQILIEKRKQAANEVQQQNNEKTVKITEEDIEFQIENITNVVSILNDQLNIFKNSSSVVESILAKLETSIKAENNPVCDNFLKLVVKELKRSNKKEDLLLVNSIIKYENLNINNLESSKLLRYSCRYVINDLEEYYPDSLKDDYLWKDLYF